MQNNLTEKEIKKAKEKLWHMGMLEWKLGSCQKNIYNFIKDNKNKVTVVNASRRIGKSVSLSAMAIEQCIKVPKSIVKFLQPEQKMIRMNIIPIFQMLLEDCPAALKPIYNKADGVYEFPNGSQIQMAGTDNGNAEKLRGGRAHLAIIDEAGFCSDLQYLINSILIPTTSTTGGRIILSSTTPPNTDHEFVEYMQQAANRGGLIVKTVEDHLEESKNDINSHLTANQVEEIISAIIGGRESAAFRTEYMCEILERSENAVIPEWTKDVEELSVVSWPKPAFCDRYVGMDIGFSDLTVALFAYVDFLNGKIVIEDELVINGPEMTTDKLAEEIKKREKELWYDKITSEQLKPLMRVADNNLHIINDLNRLHGLHFQPTAKDNRDAQISHLRMLISNHQLVIHPRCTNLINHIKFAKWDKTRKDFKRTAEFGHFDAVMALVYLCRNVNLQRNPFPKNYKYSSMGNPDDLFISPQHNENKDNIEKFVDMYKNKTSIGRNRFNK